MPTLVATYLQSWVLRTLALLVTLTLAWAICFGDPGAPEFPPYRLDVDVYRLGGEAARAGVPLYEQTFRTQSGVDLPFTYPPIAAQLFIVFAWLSLDQAATLVAVGSTIALLAVIWVTLRDLTPLRRGDLAWASIGTLAVTIHLMPFRETVSFGQINVFLMLLVLVDLTVGRDRWWRGSLIGLAAAIKLTPLVFGLYFLVRRDVRGGLQTLLVAGLLTLVGFARSPGDSVRYWTHTVLNSGRIGTPGFASNQSIEGLLARSDLPAETQQIVWLVAVVLLGLGTAVLMWRLVRQGDCFGALLANAFFGLLASPVSWSHHWVWIVPALIWLVWQRRVVLAVFAALGWALFFLAPQFRLPHGGDLEKFWTPFQVGYGNLWVWWALAFLVLTIVAARSQSQELGRTRISSNSGARVETGWCHGC